MLGVSKSTLRRMEGTELQPTIGPHNIRMFHEEEIRSVIVTRRGRMDAGSDAGELAAEAFELFDNGLGVVDAVKQLRAAPEFIESLHTHWVRLRKNMLISAEGRAAICMALIGYDDSSLRTEADVIAFLNKWVTMDSARRCLQCKSDFACFCRECAKQWGLREAMGELADAKARKL
ncbi:MAG: hypothetical protein ACOY0T_19545 [Myxococcota bacterium]